MTFSDWASSILILLIVVGVAIVFTRAPRQKTLRRHWPDSNMDIGTGSPSRTTDNNDPDR